MNIQPRTRVLLQSLSTDVKRPTSFSAYIGQTDLAAES